MTFIGLTICTAYVSIKKYINQQYAVAILLILSFINIKMFFDNRLDTLNADLSYLSFSEHQFLASEIQRLTPWTSQEAQSRVYFVGYNAYVNFFPFAASHQNINSKIISDGFFVIKTTKNLGSIKAIEKFLIRAIKESKINLAVDNGDLVVREPVSQKGNVYLVPYIIKNPAFSLSYFTNRGFGYKVSDLENRFYELVANNDLTAKTIKENEFVVNWNQCMNDQLYSNNGGLFNIVSGQNNETWLLNFTILGRSLAVAQRFVTPDCTQSYQHLSLTMYCSVLKKSQTVLLAETLGFNQSSNSLLLSPLVGKIEFSCPQPPDKIELSWANRSLYQGSSFLKFAGQKAKIQLLWSKDSRAALLSSEASWEDL